MAERSAPVDEQLVAEAESEASPQEAETPQDKAPTPSKQQILEIPVEPEAPKKVAKAEPKARGKRGPDKQPRAKPKPKARVVVEKAPAAVQEESSDESVDEVTLQELHSLNLLRSIRAYESQRNVRKQQMYASWFGR